jgi:TonB family protein
MGSDGTVLGADRAQPEALAARKQTQTIFWIALASAALVHAMFIIGIAVSHPREVGDPNGNSNAIDVELVDGSELKSSGTEAAAPPPTPQPQQAQPEQQQPQPEQKEATEAEKAEKAAEEAAAPPPLALAPTPTEAPVLPESKESAKPDKKLEQKKAEAKPAPAKPKPSKPKSNSLDLSVPWNLAMQGTTGDEGGASSATRPPGITRSGENDRFGREVIRALKKTMPPSYGTRTRITIRILLDPRGNIQQLELVQSGGKSELDQDILFAARQAVYPFPPKNATIADRTFLVTYVYR